MKKATTINEVVKQMFEHQATECEAEYGIKGMKILLEIKIKKICCDNRTYDFEKGEVVDDSKN